MLGFSGDSRVEHLEVGCGRILEGFWKDSLETFRSIIKSIGDISGRRNAVSDCGRNTAELGDHSGGNASSWVTIFDCVN